VYIYPSFYNSNIGKKRKKVLTWATPNPQLCQDESNTPNYIHLNLATAQQAKYRS
jgi:hypothetical protein